MPAPLTFVRKGHAVVTIYLTQAPAPLQLQQKSAADRGETLSVSVVAPTALAEHVAAWEDLAVHAAEPNVFYEPWMLLPALRAFGQSERLLFALVFTHGPQTRTLCGLFPLEHRRGYRGLPLNYLRLWSYRHCFLCTPLLRRGYEAASLAALFKWLDTRPEGASLFEFQEVAGEGPFHQALMQQLKLERRLHMPLDCEPRALFRPQADGEAYLNLALSHKRRKEFRRLENRVAEQGRLEYVHLTEDVEAWIDRFLSLEAAGWKGRAHTAIACDEKDRTFFTEAMREAFRRGRLMMLGLSLNGRMIAQKCSLMAGEAGFAFKIAFDEDYAHYSPGTLLELYNIRYLHAQRPIRWMDSCAVTDHFLINRLWLDRRLVQHLLIAANRPVPEFVLSALPLLRWWRRAGASFLKRISKP